MKFTALIAPLFLLAACSPRENTEVADAIVQMSEQTRTAMDDVNNAIFATPEKAHADPAADEQQVAISSAQLPPEAQSIPTSDPLASSIPGEPNDSNVKYDAPLVRVQVLLDRAHFSPGVVDGYHGENLRKAVAAYQAAKGMPVTGAPDKALLESLASDDPAPALVAYTLTEDDVRGPFRETPKTLQEMANAEALGFQRPSEAIAERFHMDEDLLTQLNPGVDFNKPGSEVVVANAGGDLRSKVASIVVDKSELSVRAYDQAGALLAFYPASVGSPETPAPSGDYAVRAVAFNPTYHFDSEKLPTFGKTGDYQKLTIPAGPNNPVGAAWIALTLETYGIHGSPEAQQISKTQSHGCVRLTNWDATELGQAVSAGTPVSFRDVGLRAEDGRKIAG